MTPKEIAESVKAVTKEREEKARQLEEKSAFRLARFREHAPVFLSNGWESCGESAPWLRKELSSGVTATVSQGFASTEFELGMINTALVNRRFATPSEVIDFVDKVERELLLL